MSFYFKTLPSLMTVAIYLFKCFIMNAVRYQEWVKRRYSSCEPRKVLLEILSISTKELFLLETSY